MNFEEKEEALKAFDQAKRNLGADKTIAAYGPTLCDGKTFVIYPDLNGAYSLIVGNEYGWSIATPPIN